jgi:hypothetical protein
MMPRILEDPDQAPVDTTHPPPERGCLFPNSSPHSSEVTYLAQRVSSVRAHAAAGRSAMSNIDRASINVGEAAKLSHHRESLGGNALSPPMLQQPDDEDEDTGGSFGSFCVGADVPTTPMAGLITSPVPVDSSCMDTDRSLTTDASGHRSISFGSPTRIAQPAVAPASFQGFGNLWAPPAR